MASEPMNAEVPSIDGEGAAAPPSRRRRLAWIERLLFASGTILLAVYAVARIDAWRSSTAALHAFDRSTAPPASGIQTVSTVATSPRDPDFRLWSDNRIRAFRQSPLTEDRALAVLELDTLELRVPVFEGTDDSVLNRGAGFVEGTSRPGEDGNIAIAGHRDGFFRGLMNVHVGDPIRLRTPDRTLLYRIDGMEIVDPENIDVLMPRAAPTLTLLTCYPFYYVGNAPQRFIVHATLESGPETQD
jgi:sortase A